MKPLKVGYAPGVPPIEDEQPEEEHGERDAGAGWHDEPQPVVRVVVVDAVDDEVKPGADRVVGLPVEDQPVEPVLGERPDEDAERDEQGELARRIALVGAEPRRPRRRPGRR